MQPTILIVEDTEDDRLLAKIGLKAANLPFSFEFVCDGYEAMQYLEGKEKYADRAIYSEPCVLITDLKMPRVDGFALLSWIRNNPIWTRLPVIVWSSSMLEEDQRAADVCGADAYVTKACKAGCLPTLCVPFGIAPQWLPSVRFNPFGRPVFRVHWSA